MTWLIMNIDFRDDRINIFTGEGFNCLIHVPFNDLTIKEKSSETVALAIKCRVKRAQAQFGFSNDSRPWVNITFKQRIHFFNIDDGRRR